MENNIIYTELQKEEINQYSNMINNVFDEFVGKDYFEQGIIKFKEYTEPKNILERFKNGSNNFYIAKYNEEIIGILEIRNKNHISLFFTKKEYHKKGIGKILFENYKKTIINNSDVNIITVNSSIYGEKFYEKLGFIKINEVQEKDGMKIIKMEYKV